MKMLRHITVCVCVSVYLYVSVCMSLCVCLSVSVCLCVSLFVLVDDSLQPYLDMIDQLDESVTSLEQAAYKLDNYSRRLGNSRLWYDGFNSNCIHVMYHFDSFELVPESSLFSGIFCFYSAHFVSDQVK